MPDLVRLDATALRVLAHPLRSRLLSQLRLHGPATATDLADVLDTNTGATSYHLRKLESVGLVTDTGTGAGKRRVWQASSRGHEWIPSDFTGDADAEASLTWLNRHYQSELAVRADHWAEAQRAWPARWRDTLGSGDDGVTVTAPQARAMWDEIAAVVQRYREAGVGDPAAIRVRVWTHLLPERRRHPAAGVVTDHLFPAAARRVLLLLTFTRWFPVGLVVGVITLWILERGLSISEALLAFSLQGIVVFLLELPTSGFADAFGRRPMLIASAIVNVIAGVVMIARRLVLVLRRRRGAAGCVPGARLRAARGVVRRHGPRHRARRRRRRDARGAGHGPRWLDRRRRRDLRRPHRLGPAPRRLRPAAPDAGLGLAQRGPPARRRGADEGAERPRRRDRRTPGCRLGAPGADRVRDGLGLLRSNRVLRGSCWSRSSGPRRWWSSRPSSRSGWPSWSAARSTPAP